jgi:2-C-methyl-D-erythritol 4-phosphate cytidylyltransferase
MRVAALLLAAGRGERLALDVPKAFVLLAGRPLLAHSLEALLACDAIERVVPVVPSAWCSGLAARLGPLARHAKLAPPVAGGATRQDSLAAGLSALPRDFALVAVHDAARPFVRAEAIARVIAAARAHGAALLAAKVSDTIKRVRGGVVVETPPRDECHAAQTPQVFRADWLREGLDKAVAEGRAATDCSQLVEALGVRVHVVAGDPDNRKITDAADLAWAERRLATGGGA